MTRIVGPSGSRRRRRMLLVLALAAVAALVLAVVSSATNTELGKFEVDGNLVATTSDGSSIDWLNTAGTGADSLSAILKCTASPCTATNYGVVTTVGDGSATGTGSLFRDWLKVGDSTTTPTFSNDQTTFTQGDKENDAGAATNVDPTCTTNCVESSPTPWHIVNGSTPPNKDDLFDVATNTIISGATSELDIGMVRTNNNGSSHLDFELNRSDWVPGGTDGVDCATNTTGITGFKCPVRTEGDLLISFEISPDGTAVERFFVWDLPGGTNANGHGQGGATGSVDCQGALAPNKDKPCPWEEIQPPLSDNGILTVLTGVNAAPIPAPPWGFKNPNGTTSTTIPTGGWFEAGINLSALGFAPSCPGFGTASAKARSSGDSVTSALTDLAGPFPINLNTCGKIIVKKVTVPSPDPTDSTFAYTASYNASGFSLKNGQQNDSGQLAPGNYSVSENTPLPSGFTLTSATCDNGNAPASITLGANQTVTCTFTNTLQQGAIKITKTAKNKLLGTGDKPQSGVTFTVDGTTVQTGLDGTACVDHLSFGNHTVTETVPTGYKADSTNPQTIDVETNATCGSGNETPATFHNSPLTTITVRTNSLAGTGVTTSTVQCAAESTTSDADAGHTTTGLVPGTYTCTVVIDP